MATMPKWLKHVIKFFIANWVYKGSIPFRSTNFKIMSKLEYFTNEEICLELQDLMETIKSEDTRNLLKEAIKRLSIKPRISFNDEQFNI